MVRSGQWIGNAVTPAGDHRVAHARVVAQSSDLVKQILVTQSESGGRVRGSTQEGMECTIEGQVEIPIHHATMERPSGTLRTRWQLDAVSSPFSRRILEST